MKMKSSIKCPFCGVNYSTFDDNISYMLIYTNNNGLNHYIVSGHTRTFSINKTIKAHPDIIILFMCVCPNCKKTYSYIRKIGSQYKEDSSNIVNISPAMPLYKISKYSKYVPKEIFTDYKEAYGVLYTSPQSSATLSRRILEEIIENYFNITNGTLFNKINELSNTNKLDEGTINTIHDLRKIGNIGAHMKEKRNKIIRIDNVGEARILLKMIELLFDKTYVAHANNTITEDSVKELEGKYYK